MRAHRLRWRQCLWPTLRALADRTDHADWLTHAIDTMTTDPEPRGTPSLSWGPDLRMPPWATADAVHSAREVLTGLTAAREPLAPQRAQHAALLYARAAGRATRRLDQATSGAGLVQAAPFLDDAVLEAALSVCLHDRASATATKPLLTAAMSGLVPDQLLARTGKGDYSTDFYTALKHHRGELLDLFDTSRLADLGLIDVHALRAALLAPHPTTSIITPLSHTLGCEMWLRAQSHARPTSIGNPR